VRISDSRPFWIVNLSAFVSVSFNKQLADFLWRERVSEYLFVPVEEFFFADGSVTVGVQLHEHFVQLFQFRATRQVLNKESHRCLLQNGPRLEVLQVVQSYFVRFLAHFFLERVALDPRVFERFFSWKTTFFCGGQQLRDEVSTVATDVLPVLCWELETAVCDCVLNSFLVYAVEWDLTGKHHVGQNSNSPEINSSSIRFILDDLRWREVGMLDFIFEVDSFLQNSWLTKASEFDLSAFLIIEHDARRVDVSVHNSLSMRELKCFENLSEYLDRLELCEVNWISEYIVQASAFWLFVKNI